MKVYMQPAWWKKAKGIKELAIERFSLLSANTAPQLCVFHLVSKGSVRNQMPVHVILMGWSSMH